MPLRARDATGAGVRRRRRRCRHVGASCTVVEAEPALDRLLALGQAEPSASRRPSPRVLNARIVSAIAMPGTRSCHGCVIATKRAPLLEHRAPARLAAGVAPTAEEAQTGFGEQRRRRSRGTRATISGDAMFGQDPVRRIRPGFGTHRSRRLDEGLLADRERLRADQPGEAREHHDRDREHRVLQARGRGPRRRRARAPAAGSSPAASTNRMRTLSVPPPRKPASNPIGIATSNATITISKPGAAARRARRR